MSATPPPPQSLIKTPPISFVEWHRSFRLIPSRFPTVSLFERVADPDELEVTIAIESLTNPRLRDELGQIALIPPSERVSGPGTTPVMSAFCHLNPLGSRFSDGSWGVYYAADSLVTAVTEVAHHHALFLSSTNEAPIDIDMRAYVGHVRADLHDVRGQGWDEVHDPDNLSASQALARHLRQVDSLGSWGIAYRSVRHAGGECVALLRPRAIKPPVIRASHVTLHWHGSGFDKWYEKTEPKLL